jgi:hypothetical protein
VQEAPAAPPLYELGALPLQSDLDRSRELLVPRCASTRCSRFSTALSRNARGRQEHRQLPFAARLVAAQDVDAVVVALDLDGTIVSAGPLVAFNDVDPAPTQMKSSRRCHSAMVGNAFNLYPHRARLRWGAKRFVCAKSQARETLTKAELVRGLLSHQRRTGGKCARLRRFFVLSLNPVS